MKLNSTAAAPRRACDPGAGDAAVEGPRLTEGWENRRMCMLGNSE